jgi:hypothetical protein
MIEDMDLLEDILIQERNIIYRHSVRSSHWLSKSQEKAGREKSWHIIRDLR